MTVYLSGISRNIKRKKQKVEYLRYNNFPFFRNQNFVKVKCQKQPSSILKYFLKISGKHLWCRPNISKIFNRPPENRFNNRQYTTHIEQLIDVLR